MALDPQDVCAIILTRGDVNLGQIWESLPEYGEVLVVFPAYTRVYRDRLLQQTIPHPADRKVYGRYAAIQYTDKPVIYFQDDDIVFTEHKALMAAYEPGKLISNMGQEWIEAQAYYDLALVGLGSLIDRDLPAKTLKRYTDAFPDDDRFDIDADFAHGVLTPFKRVDLGAEILPSATDPSRLSMQPGQMEGKWRTIRQARSLRTVVLTMMAKNEEENIIRALDSAEGLFDSFCLMDTGSTDDTILFAQEWCDSKGVEFASIVTDFVDFGTNRNQLLEAGRALGDFVLLMDADEEFIEQPNDHGHIGWEHLCCDAYFLHYAGNIDYSQPRLLFSQFPWYFDGEAHAALDADRSAVCIDLRQPKIVHHGDNRHGTEKLKSDIELLTKDIKNPERAHELGRNLFLRGKAYEGLKMWESAIGDYVHRLTLSQGDEEAYYSRFRLGVILIEQFGELSLGADHLMTAYLERPSRVESIRALAHYLTVVADSTPYPLDDKIIVHRNLYKTHD